jgi:diaminopimelate decarboxylase
LKLPGLRIEGIDIHIGSQITDLAPFDAAFALVAEFIASLRAEGVPINHIDLGGGLGIPYSILDDPESYHPDRYAAIVKRHFNAFGCEIILEPGRLIVGNAGVLVTTVLFVKQGDARTFVIVDAAMNDLVRPTLYDAHHDILSVRETQAASKTVDVVGPVCETGDYLALDRTMPVPVAGDLLAVMSAGAYGAVQAGTYNSRLLVPEVLVSGADFAVIRPRGTYDELIAQDKIPAWLK